jgi:hypothetical protein
MKFRGFVGRSLNLVFCMGLVIGYWLRKPHQVLRTLNVSRGIFQKSRCVMEPYHASFFDGCGGGAARYLSISEIRVHDPKFWRIWVMSPDFPEVCPVFVRPGRRIDGPDLRHGLVHHVEKGLWLVGIFLLPGGFP